MARKPKLDVNGDMSYYMKRKLGLITVAPRGSSVVVNAEPVIEETEAEIEARLAERFGVMQELVDCSIHTQEIRSIIISGPAGVGKSFGVFNSLSSWDPHENNHIIVKGYVKTTGLYKLLYQYRNPGQVIVFDDADSIFSDDISINMLKAVCDTSKTRRVSYLGEFAFFDDETGEKLPKSFEFEGTIIFITNNDFDAMIERGSKLSPHLQAMISRSNYLDLSMKSKRDYLVRIKQVVQDGMLKELGLDSKAERDVLEFIQEHNSKLRELSLRMAQKIGVQRKLNPTSWERKCRVLFCK